MSAPAAMTEDFQHALRRLGDRKVRSVHGKIGARVRGAPLFHQFADTRFQRLAAFEQLGPLVRRAAHARRDYFGPRAEADDHARTLERVVVALIDQRAAAGRDDRWARFAALRAAGA